MTCFVKWSILLFFYVFQGDACPKATKKERDEFRPTSCLDYLLKGASKCGIYKLYDNGGNSFPAYCDLKSEPETAWTLVMSLSNVNRKLPAFLKTAFKQNAPVNENAQNWNLYRLSLARMRSLQETCSKIKCFFPKCKIPRKYCHIARNKIEIPAIF